MEAASQREALDETCSAATANQEQAHSNLSTDQNRGVATLDSEGSESNLDSDSDDMSWPSGTVTFSSFYPVPPEIAEEINGSPSPLFPFPLPGAYEMVRAAAGWPAGGIQIGTMANLVSHQMDALDKPFLGTLNRARRMLATMPTPNPVVPNSTLFTPSRSASAQGVSFIPSGNSAVRAQATARLTKLDVLLVNMDEHMLGVELVGAVLTAFHRRFHIELTGRDRLSPDTLVGYVTWIGHVLEHVNEALGLTRKGRENKPLRVHMRMLESFIERQIKRIWDEL